MTERPILFSGPMVRAIIEGRKTVTRRLVNPRMFLWEGQSETDCEHIEQNNPRFGEKCLELVRCPYGVAGDTLWVKEAWRPKISHCCAMDACDCSDVNVFYREGHGEPVFFGDRSIPALVADLDALRWQ